ncbi:MAG: EAL domain-containing protein [Rhizobiaceae bacterium]|nr:EAL domain-containing protein [Rhizobiaceae bacterium]
MNSVVGSVIDLAASDLWLITANFILSVLLGLWMMRYRRLYLGARLEREANDETIETLTEGIYRSLPDGTQMRANRALVKLNGYDSEAEMLAAVKDIAKEWYVDPTRRDDFMTILERDGFVQDFVSEIYRHKTRERIWITESARLVRDKATGQVRYYEGSVREITETVERLRLEEQFRNLVRQVPGALFQYRMLPDGSVSMVYLSPGYQKLTGLPIPVVMQDPTVFLRHVPEEDRALFGQSLSEAWGKQQAWEVEHKFVTPRGEQKWLRVSATPEFKGGEVLWHGYLSDITQHKEHELEIRTLAYYDTLTNLPNRRLFLDRMASAIAASRETGRHGAVLFVDLDNFKTLNDTQGHDTGDRYLVQVAERLTDCVGDRGTVARIGGDEFVVLLESIGSDNASASREAIGIASRINGAMRQRFELGEVSYRASASIGIVVFDQQADTADEVLKRADIAMYEAKSMGRDSLVLFDPVSLGKASERYELLSDLREAIGQGGDQLELHFQPQVDAEGRISAAEGLLRWNHPDQGMIYPDRFIPVSEQFGLANELGLIVLEKGISALARWAQDSTLAGIGLSINASAQCFTNDDFIPKLTRMLEQYQVSGSKLTIEITEHVTGRDEHLVARRMRDLKALGVRLSLDDFGTGYSSLTYLKKLPFDEVKIDGSFVADIETAESDRALVRTILAMAKTLGIAAVAEHVETAAQEEFLKQHGCDYCQGWLYAKAMPATEFAAHVKAADPTSALVRTLRRPA